MIKEKHEKADGGGGGGGVKEEPGGSEKDTGGGGGVKKEEDIGSTASGIKKESRVGVTKNGTILGSLHDSVKTEQHDEDAVGQQTVKDELDTDLPPDAFNLVSGAPSEGVQTLPSNVISKQPSSMEVQYMQQQSQIFVFSTVLANTGADEVLQGRFPSIIAFHCSQPGTKKYLEKNPLKMAQFHRQGHTQWPTAPPKKCVRSPPAPSVKQTPPTSVGMPPAGPALDFLSGDPLEDIGLGDGDLPWENKDGENGLGDDMDACGVQPSLQGVKVPDENLTPQQRQHREEQLATIRKLHEMLCSDAPGGPGGPAGPGGGAPPSQGGPQQPPVSTVDGLDLPGPPLDWQKMQYKPGHGPPRGAGGPGAPGPRLQGPPPPYHQTPRSASVPIALQSPNPASPNNPTSNLSLPSPSRASSALNSPADGGGGGGRPFGLQRHVSATGQSPTSQDSPSRPNHSNPGTPISSHLSPSVNTSSADTNPSSDGLFGRTLQSMAAQQKQMAVPTSGGASSSMQPKEPNLMPVPSPQQIQYLNAFEGQELIIQKQPNTSLNKDGNMISPPVLPTTMDSGFPGSNDMAHSRLSGPNTPTSLDMGPRFPGTPSDGCRFSVPSPHTPSGADKPNRLSGTGPGLSPQTSGPPLGGDPIKGDMFPTPSPHMMDVPRFPGPSPSPGNKMGFVNVSPSGCPGGPGGPVGGKPPMEMGGPGPNYGCGRNDNVPLNPNCTNAMSSNPKVSHFDPISSLAQMSQQLTNSVASSLNGQGGPGGGGPGMMNFGSPGMHMMDMGGCHGMPDMGDPMVLAQMQQHGPPHGFHPGSPMGGPIRSLSPKLPGFGNHVVGMSMPRMMGRPPPGSPNPYNGANVQVKPNAPNTIQYMPAKSQVGGGGGGQPPPGPRAPPSLEFLQRYANPMGPGGPGVPTMDGKLPPGHPGQGMPYFPGCGPNGPMGGHMDGPGGPMQDGPMGPMGMGNGGGPMMGGPPNMGMMSMMRPMRPPPPQAMMRMPMGFNGPPNGPGGGGGPPDGMFQPGGGPPNAQMFVGGPKGSPMGMGGGGGGPADAGQPLPPSMSQNPNSFKSSPFVGGGVPTTADPNYAQQFHNFQQQLYATGTRNPMGGGGGGQPPMGPGPGPPMHPQQAYFNPK